MVSPSQGMVLVPADGNHVWDEDAVIIGPDEVSDFNEENILPQPEDIFDKNS